MQESLMGELRARRAEIHAAWEALLRAEPINTPLGHPDSLVHLIDWSLDEIFAALANPLHRSRLGGTRFAAGGHSVCPCGRNPLLAYFVAGGQALREALILAQAALAPLDPLQRDASFEELNLVIREISRREIEAFCGVCQFRHSTPDASVQAVAIDGRSLSGYAAKNAVEL